MSKAVLIVDDSTYSRLTLKNTLQEAGYEIIGEAKNGEEALDKIMTLDPDIVTLDNVLPDITGLQILKTLQGEKIRSKIIMISAVGQQSAIDEAKSLGATAYLIKPFLKENLLIEMEKLS